MYFKCLEVVRQGEFLRYRYGYLPDGAQGHEGSCNCQVYISESTYSFGEALAKAHKIHSSHVPYQQEMLYAEGYTPMWVYVD